MKEINGGVVLITGGSRGIGRAIVEEVCDEDFRVAFTWRSSEVEAREIEEVTKGRALAFPFELSDRSRPAPLVAEIESRLGPICGLVNNAGIQRAGLMALTSDESWDEVLDINLGGAFRLTREVLREMVPRRRGSIVNISSLSALIGIAGHASYAASKAGLVAITRSLAREMGSRNIRVNAVIPGYVATDMTSDLSPEVISHLRAAECLSGGVDAPAVAKVVKFLLSDSSSGVTGQALPVDAGTSA